MNEDNEDNLKLLHNAIKIYGIFDDKEIVHFIKSNLSKMVNVEFV